MRLKRLSWLLMAISCLPLAGNSQTAQQTAKSVLERAHSVLGAPETLGYTGSGVHAVFGQSFAAGGEWPRHPLSKVTIAVNFSQRAWRQDSLYQSDGPPGGRNQNAEVNGDVAWSIAADGTARPATVDDSPFIGPEERQLRIWMTPQGFVRAALAAPDVTASASTQNGRGTTLVRFTALNKFKLRGTIDESGEITSIATEFPNRVLGDMPYEYRFSEYKSFGTVRFPTRILLTAGGFPVDDWTITTVTANQSFDQPVPPSVANAPPRETRVENKKLADGVWWLSGGSHHSVLVEFRDFLTVIEGPLGEARSAAVIKEAKKLAPNKPIRYVVNSHHHFDHAGGLRTYVAEGATVVTDASNQAYFKQAFSAPATVEPDAQSTARREPKIQTVRDKFVITDGARTIEVYTTSGYQHTSALIMPYILPARILVEADVYSAGSPQAKYQPKGDAIVYANHAKRLRLQPTIIAGLHGTGPVPYSDFEKFIAEK